jgi:hypothetical protein
VPKDGSPRLTANQGFRVTLVKDSVNPCIPPGAVVYPYRHAQGSYLSDLQRLTVLRVGLQIATLLCAITKTIMHDGNRKHAGNVEESERCGS